MTYTASLTAGPDPRHPTPAPSPAASKTFSGDLRVFGQLRSPSLPLQNLLLVDADQIVTGAAFFHSDVTVHSALAVRRPISGQYDVTEMESLFVTDADNVTIDGDVEIWVSRVGRGQGDMNSIG